ncbi:MAG: phenylacetate-CoA oxygenase subunit PaaJ [Saprospiraceae bacterium]|nr:phenylacetate-CoA oxygenase subunit PaaJ [Saprospiraceae bacterium]
MTETKINTSRTENAKKILHEVYDPEIPVLSVLDLGVIRSIREVGEILEVDITPTYSACPAMKVIEMSVQAALDQAGLGPVKINTVLDPVWTTDWMSAEGKVKLLEYGIAPPHLSARIKNLSLGNTTISCPQCASTNTVCISEFGSTACKALYKCKDCLEPFDYFKCH